MRRWTAMAGVCLVVALAAGCGGVRSSAMSMNGGSVSMAVLPTVSSGWVSVNAGLFGSRDIPSETPAVRIAREAAEGAKWVDGAELHVEGRGWDDTKSFWNRLPARAEGMVPGDVWFLSQNTAGMAVRFATDSRHIHARWSGGGAMDHMPATGVSGLDLYVREADGAWRFAGVGRPQEGETFVTLGRDLGAEDGAPREYLLFLPLYKSVSLFEVGFDAEAEVLVPSAEEVAAGPKPIVFYGTSITQGGCASRTGMAHPAILRRRLDREVINLGFSGSGRMEPELALLVRELDVSLIVLDNLPNLNDELARERIVPFVRSLREVHEETPILLVEDFRRLPVRNAILRDAVDQLQGEGVKNLHYMEAGQGVLLNGEEGTVDGVHPTDLGFLVMADAFEPYLRGILGTE